MVGSGYDFRRIPGNIDQKPVVEYGPRIRLGMG